VSECDVFALDAGGDEPVSVIGTVMAVSNRAEPVD
jgi:hypothetical protein